MKNTIHGFSQQAAIELGLDWRDLTFLDWFAYWYSSRTMKMVTVDEQGYYAWVNRGYVLEQLPILGLSHVDSISKLLSGLVTKGFLERHVAKNDERRGSLAYYRPTKMVIDLQNVPVQNTTPEHDQHAKQPGETGDQQVNSSGGQPGPAGQTTCPNTTSLENNTTSLESMGANAPEPLPPVVSPPAKPKRELAPLKDDVAAMWEARLTKLQPADTWADFAKERRQCINIAKRSRNMLPQSPYETMNDLIDAVLAEFRKLKKTAKQSDAYWSNAPYTPSAVMTRWPQIWHGLVAEHERVIRCEHDAKVFEGLPW